MASHTVSSHDRPSRCRAIRYLGTLLVALCAVASFGHSAVADPGNGNGVAAEHATSGTAATSGSPTSPQPPSNADETGHGANTGPGPYTSTRDGSPSLNGSGNGNATGEPCAGCVGKADNKNPPGQLPNGTDANAGYECDTNHGIGQTNPAHTGCSATVEQPPPEQPPQPKPQEQPSMEKPTGPTETPAVSPNVTPAIPGGATVSSPPIAATPAIPPIEVAGTSPLVTPPPVLVPLVVTPNQPPGTPVPVVVSPNQPPSTPVPVVVSPNQPLDTPVAVAGPPGGVTPVVPTATPPTPLAFTGNDAVPVIYLSLIMLAVGLMCRIASRPRPRHEPQHPTTAR